MAPKAYVEDTGSTETTYTDTDATPGVENSYRVKAINPAGLIGERSNYVSLVPLTLVENSAATGAPAIKGAAQVGVTLSVDTSGISDTDGLDNVSYSYQWIRIDGDTANDISEATGSSYELSAGDLGKNIKVRVSFSDDANNRRP